MRSVALLCALGSAWLCGQAQAGPIYDVTKFGGGDGNGVGLRPNGSGGTEIVDSNSQVLGIFNPAPNRVDSLSRDWLKQWFPGAEATPQNAYQFSRFVPTLLNDNGMLIGYTDSGTTGHSAWREYSYYQIGEDGRPLRIGGLSRTWYMDGGGGGDLDMNWISGLNNHNQIVGRREGRGFLADLDTGKEYDFGYVNSDGELKADAWNNGRPPWQVSANVWDVPYLSGIDDEGRILGRGGNLVYYGPLLFTPQAVPEPSTLMIMGLGLLGCASRPMWRGFRGR